MTRRRLRVEEYFRSVEIKQPLSLWSRIERLAWGAPIWQFAIRSIERRTERLIDKTDEYGTKTRRRLRAYFFFLIRVDDYGRLLSRAARTQIRGLRDAGASKTLIRDAVIGRLLHRHSGQMKLTEWRSRLVLALGIIWHALAMVSAVILLTLVIALPGPAISKFLVSGAMVVFFVFSIAFINALTIRQFFALPELAVICDTLRRPVKSQLRAVS